MAMPRKSLDLHELQGTKPHYDTKTQSVFAGGRPKIPSHLSRPARAEFKRCVQILENRGTITPGDMATLAVYAEVYGRWVRCKKEIGDKVMIETVVTDNHGTAHTVQKLHPLLKIVQSCEARLLALVRTLGLTPVDRDKARQTAGSSPEKPADPMENFLQRKPLVVPFPKGKTNEVNREPVPPPVADRETDRGGSEQGE